MPAVRERMDQVSRSPVFVDSSGRRRRWVTWVLGATALACGGYLLLLAFSLTGGPLTPQDLLPIPDPPANSEERVEDAEQAPSGPAAPGASGAATPTGAAGGTAPSPAGSGTATAPGGATGPAATDPPPASAPAPAPAPTATASAPADEDPVPSVTIPPVPSVSVALPSVTVPVGDG